MNQYPIYYTVYRDGLFISSTKLISVNNFQMAMQAVNEELDQEDILLYVSFTDTTYMRVNILPLHQFISLEKESN